MTIQLVKPKTIPQPLPVSKKLDTLRKNHPEFNSIYLEGAGIICRDGLNQALIVPNSDAEYYIDLEYQPKEAFIYILKNIVMLQKPTVNLAFDILEIARELDFEEKAFFEIFHLLSWPASKKGYDYYQACRNFSSQLKTMVFTKKVSLKEAFIFHTCFMTDYDKLLLLVPEKLSFSMTNDVFRFLVEISRKTGNKADTLCEVLRDVTDKGFYKRVHELRFPNYTGYLNRLETFIGSFNLPKGTVINYDKTLEKESYKLEITFKDSKSLRKKLQALNTTFEDFSTSGKPDLFNQDNLFDTSDT